MTLAPDSSSSDYGRDSNISIIDVSCGVANARLAFENTGRHGYTVAAWIKNLTNRQYLAYALNQKDADTGLLGFDYALVGEPRTYGLEATLRF